MPNLTGVSLTVTETALRDRLPEALPADPMPLAKAWLDDATASAGQRNPNAMVLSTVDDSGEPSSRVVLCKAWHSDPGYLVFYTNYRSRKANDLSTNARASVVFHWDSLGRQVRIEGATCRSPAAESDAYFASRDRGSQLGAWGSDQSEPIASRDALLKQLTERSASLGDEQLTVPRPPHWGGFRVIADAVELWIEGANRVHDRARWTRKLSGEPSIDMSATAWSGTRLQP